MIVAWSAGLVLIGCGDHSPVPSLPKGARIVAKSHECPVSPDSCLDYEIVTGAGSSSAKLRDAQVATLREDGWKLMKGVTPHQRFACSADKSASVSVATGKDALADDRGAAAGRDAGLTWSQELAGKLRQEVRDGGPVIVRIREGSC
jgi:hypothetical protein